MRHHLSLCNKCWNKAVLSQFYHASDDAVNSFYHDLHGTVGSFWELSSLHKDSNQPLLLGIYIYIYKYKKKAWILFICSFQAFARCTVLVCRHIMNRLAQGKKGTRHQAPDDILQELVRVEDRTMGSLSQTKTDREMIVLFQCCSSSSSSRATVCLWECKTNCSFPAFTGPVYKATVSQPAHHGVNHKPAQDPNLFIMPQIWLSTGRGREKLRQFTQSTGW